MALNQQQMRMILSMRSDVARKMKQDANAIKTTSMAAQTLTRALRGVAAAATAATARLAAMRGTMAGMPSMITGMFTLASGAAAIRIMSEFGDRIAVVRGVTGATEAQFEELRAKAEQLGIETRFTAGQAAQGMEMLARAGFDVGETLGSIEAALRLASAGALDLGSAADIVTNIMSGFALKSDSSKMAVDQLAFTAANANTNILQLGEAMKMASGSANAFNVNMTESLAALAALADRGVRGTMAGTGLRRVLAKMATETPKLVNFYRGLGLTIEQVATTSTGSLLVSLERLSDAIAERGGLVEHVEELLKVYGMWGGPIAVALISNMEKFRTVLKGLDEASEGFADRLSFIMEDNLGGAIRRLRSAFEGFFISLNQDQSGPFRDGIEKLAFALRTLAGGDMDEIQRQVGALFARDQVGQAVLDAEQSLQQMGLTNEEVAEKLKEVRRQAELTFGEGFMGRIRDIASLIKSLGVAVLAFGAAMIAATITQPWFLMAAAITGVAFWIDRNSEKMVSFGGYTASVGSIAGAVFARLGTHVSNLWNSLRDFTTNAISGLQDWLSANEAFVGGASEGMQRFLNLVISVVASLIDVWINGYRIILTAAINFADAASKAMIAPAKAAAAAMKGQFDEARSIMAQVPAEFAQIGEDAALQFQQAVADVGDNFGTDFVGNMIGAVRQEIDTVMLDAVGRDLAKATQEGIAKGAEEGLDPAIQEAIDKVHDIQGLMDQAAEGANFDFKFADELAKQLAELRNQAAVLGEAAHVQDAYNRLAGLGVNIAERATWTAEERAGEEQLLAAALDYQNALQADKVRLMDLDVAKTQELIAMDQSSSRAVAVKTAQIEAYYEAMAAGIEPTEAYMNAVRDLAVAELELENNALSMAEGVSQAWEEWKQAALDTGTQVKEALGGALTGMTDAFVEFAVTGKGSFGDFASSVVKDILRIIIQLQVLKAVQAGMGLFGFSSGGVVAAAPSASPNVTPFAKGGIVRQPTTFPMSQGLGLMGEAGPEAIMPLARSSDGSLGVKMAGGMGGGSTFAPNITINMSGGSDAGMNEQVAAGVAKAVDAVLKTQMAEFARDEVRRGRRLSRSGY